VNTASIAWTYARWGNADVLELREIMPGPLAADAVRVAVEWAGVNPADCKVLAGKYRLLARGGFSRRIGIEGAGHVLEVGSAVAGLTPGARVIFGLDLLDGSRGAWAAQVDVPVRRVITVPAGISLRDAAVMPIAGLTAWQMCRMANVGLGQDVLVTGASGGVGHMAVQIARNLGAKVSATGSERNRPLIASLGAESFLDYRSMAPERTGRRWNAVLDCVNSLRAASGAILAPGGHYVDTDPRPFTMLADRIRNLAGSRKRHTVMVDIEPTGVGALFEALAAGLLKPVFSREYPLVQAPEAIRESLGGHVTGKLVLKIP
jgi:NADPH:quinone reductase-like Zn-dependent oxidoreductase